MLMVASLQISIELLGSQMLVAFVDIAGCTTDWNKMRSLKIIHLVYEVECEISSTELEAFLLGSFKYDG